MSSKWATAAAQGPASVAGDEDAASAVGDGAGGVVGVFWALQAVAIKMAKRAWMSFMGVFYNFARSAR